MDKNLINTLTQQLTTILGDRNSQAYNERLAAIHAVVGNLTTMIGMDDANRTAPWAGERITASREFLIMEPWFRKQAADVMCRELAHQVAGRLKEPKLIPYLEPIARWAMFDKDDTAHGVTLALQNPGGLAAVTRWSAIYEMIAVGLWRVQTIMPGIVGHPDFRPVKIQIWSMIYGCLPSFTSTYEKLRDLEVPLPPADSPRKDPSKIKVGVWSLKLGDFLSSATQVHPWLMALPEPGLEVYILSERKRPDPVQNKYREIYGANFIDCDGLSDDEFVKMVRGLDLDVFIPLHPSRGDLIEKTRLARCHLDTWADMAIYGVPDITVASKGMLVPEFLKTTSRKFVVIPDPPHVYSALPDIPLKDRDPSSRFVFGAFNRAPKMNPVIFDVWANVMLACPKAALLVAFLQVDFFTEYVLKSELGKRGVEPSRITVLPRVPHPEHLERHNQIDLMLDTAPMGGGMTAVDTFFMGVPLLSLNIDHRPSALHTNNAFFNVLGKTAGTSANSADEYIAYAKARYAEGPLCKALRQKLRDLAVKSPLFDHEGYMRLIRLVIKAAVSNTGEQLTPVMHDPRRKITG